MNNSLNFLLYPVIGHLFFLVKERRGHSHNLSVRVQPTRSTARPHTNHARTQSGALRYRRCACDYHQAPLPCHLNGR